MNNPAQYPLHGQQLGDDTDTRSHDTLTAPSPFNNLLPGSMEQEAYGLPEVEFSAPLWRGYQEPYGLDNDIIEAQPLGVTDPWHPRYAYPIFMRTIDANQPGTGSVCVTCL